MYSPTGFSSKTEAFLPEQRFTTFTKEQKGLSLEDDAEDVVEEVVVVVVVVEDEEDEDVVVVVVSFADVLPMPRTK